METTSKAEEILQSISSEGTKLGDLRKIAKAIKKDHQLATELWSNGGFAPRQLAILIMDKKLLSREIVDQLIADIEQHEMEERLALVDWLMANQLMKDKGTVALIESWEMSNVALKRRVFWYYQARLRWTGQVPPPNTAELLRSIEANLSNESPEVQWAMNFTAGQIGVHDPDYRDQCVVLGEKVGLYKDEKVARGCTPSYLPEFIRIEVAKLKS